MSLAGALCGVVVGAALLLAVRLIGQRRQAWPRLGPTERRDKRLITCLPAVRRYTAIRTCRRHVQSIIGLYLYRMMPLWLTVTLAGAVATKHPTWPRLWCVLRSCTHARFSTAQQLITLTLAPWTFAAIVRRFHAIHAHAPRHDIQWCGYNGRHKIFTIP